MDSESFARAMEALGNYLEYLRRRGRKEITIKGYKNAIKVTLRWLAERGMECEPERIGEDEIVALLNGYGASESTRKMYLDILSGFLEKHGNRVVREMGLLWNELAHPNVRWITPEDMARVLDSLEHPTDRIIVMLSAYAGMRRGEIAALRLEDILSDRVVVTGKGHGQGKQRIIPLSIKVAAEIERYMAFRRQHVTDQQVPELVIAFDRTNGIHGMSAGGVGRRIERLCRRLGIDASTHSFRRFFATQAWNAMPSKDLKVLQRLMGHTTATMTLRYIQCDEAAMRDTINRL